jgi:hypothetical protein
MMLDRHTSRVALADAENNARTVLATTPDDPDYTTSADRLAHLVRDLAAYLRHLDQG